MKCRFRRKLYAHGLFSVPLTQAVLAEVREVNHNKSDDKPKPCHSVLVCT